MTKPPAGSSLLFGALADSGRIKQRKNGSYKMVLRGVEEIDWFSDRPDRVAGEWSPKKLVKKWDALFGDIEPNAQATFDLGSKQKLVTFEMFKPKLSNSSQSISFKVRSIGRRNKKLLAGLKGKRLDEMSLFVDDTNSGCATSNADLLGKFSELSNKSESALFALLRQELSEVQNFNLSYSDLSNMNFAGLSLHGANFAVANLTDANLTGADLTGANFAGADLSDTDLGGANLAGAVLSDADLTDADLSQATLTGVKSGGIKGTPTSLPPNWKLINGYLTGPGADLSDADLTGSDLTDADLSQATLTCVKSGSITGKPASLPPNWKLFNGYLIGRGTDLSDVDLSDVNLIGADLSDADLSNANLRGANLGITDLTGADLSDANLTGAVLAGSTLTGVKSGGILGTPSSLPKAGNGAYSNNWNIINGFLLGQGANLTGADLTMLDGTKLNYNLTTADLTLANLSGARLNGIIFTNANLRSANLANANLADADLGGADLTGANFSGATNLDDADWVLATCPDGSVNPLGAPLCTPEQLLIA